MYPSPEGPAFVFPWLALLLLFAVWKLACMWLRYRRSVYLATLKQDPWNLLLATIYVEFPWISTTALQFGLFRTYAIPTISKVLSQTGRLSHSTAKRADETEILLQEVLFHHVDSERGSYALKRLNFIHSHYDISNDDYLYTLGVLIFQPIYWASRYGYREWNRDEQEAAFKVWHDIGVRMGMKQVPSTLPDFSKFVEDYELENMVYSPTSRGVADGTVELLLGIYAVPTKLRPLGRKLVYAMLDDRLREAFGYPKQPPVVSWAIHRLLGFVAGTLVRLFMPPRPLSMPWSRIQVDTSSRNPSAEPDKVRELRSHPYKPAAFKDGYKLSEIGPFKVGRTGTAGDGSLMCPFRG